MVDTAQSAYHVLKSARDTLRDNLSTIIVSLNAEGTVLGHAAPSPEGDDIFVGRLRIPPQNEQWVSMFNSAEFERLGLNVGQSRTSFRLHVMIGIRSQTYRTDSGGGVPLANTTEDAGWLRAHLLSRAVDTCLGRYLMRDAAVVQIRSLGRSQQPSRKDYPDVYEIESRYDIMMRTSNPVFTT
jgi:hypothetical protein